MSKPGRYASDKVAMAALVSNLEKLPDNMLQCKSMLHAWAVENDYHVETVVYEGRRRIQHIARLLVCMRGCGTFRKSTYIIGKNGLEKLSQSYTYTNPAYKMPGLPRGVKPGDVVRNEEYSRTLTKAAKRLVKKG